MQKCIRITAVIAGALVALSLFLISCSFLVQQGLVRSIYGITVDSPVIPVAQLVNCCLLLGCSVLLILFAGNGKVGIWSDILVFVLIALMLPALSAVLSYLQTMASGWFGSGRVSAYSAVSALVGYCMWSANLGRCMMLAVCGMSIVYKRKG